MKKIFLILISLIFSLQLYSQKASIYRTFQFYDKYKIPTDTIEVDTIWSEWSQVQPINNLIVISNGDQIKIFTQDNIIVLFIFSYQLNETYKDPNLSPIIQLLAIDENINIVGIEFYYRYDQQFYEIIFTDKTMQVCYQMKKIY